MGTGEKNQLELIRQQQFNVSFDQKPCKGEIIRDQIFKLPFYAFYNIFFVSSVEATIVYSRSIFKHFLWRYLVLLALNIWIIHFNIFRCPVSSSFENIANYWIFLLCLPKHCRFDLDLEFERFI